MVSPEPTKATEPTEAPEPTEVVEPTPEPEEDLIIEGYNISEFNRRDEHFTELSKQLEFDTYKLIAITSMKRVETILSDGDTYQVREGDDVQFNYLVLYSPIEIGQLDVIEPSDTMIKHFEMEFPGKGNFEAFEILDVPDEGVDLKLEIWSNVVGNSTCENMIIHVTK